MSLLQHRLIISRKVHKTIEKAQNISSKSHRLTTIKGLFEATTILHNEIHASV